MCIRDSPNFDCRNSSVRPFVRSSVRVEAGERASRLMTIIGTAIRNDLDVQGYLEDILRRALEGETNWSSLAPQAWKLEHPNSVRAYRVDERRQASDRKRVTRARRRRLKK